MLPKPFKRHVTHKWFWLLLIYFAVYNKAVAQSTSDTGIECITYIDSVPNTTLSRQRYIETRNSPTTNGHGTTRLPSRQGKMVALCEEGYFMTEGVKRCLKLAMDSWEEKLTNIVKPIQFKVSVSEDLDDDIGMISVVYYQRINSQRKSITCSLYSQGHDLPDGIDKDSIVVNAFVDWHSSWSNDDTYTGDTNLTVGFMRHIARILGFGSTIVKNIDGNLRSSISMLSDYDRLMTDGNTSLSSMMSNQDSLRAFFSRQTYLRLSSNSTIQYPLHNYGEYVPYKSGCFLSLGTDNILEHNISNRQAPLSISREILNVMKDIGWSIQEDYAVIECDSIDALGYGSIYRPLTFYARLTNNSNLLSGNWTYQIFNSSTNTYQDVSCGSGNSFRILPQIHDSALDMFNCQQARVLFTQSDTSSSFPLTLETRPDIKNVVFSNFRNIGTMRYTFDVDIVCSGGTSGSVTISDATGAATQYAYTGNTINVNPIIRGYQAYADINISNSYGLSKRFIPVNQPSFSADIGREHPNAVCTVIHSEQSDNTLRDGDRFELRLEDETGIDSVKWFVRTRGIDGKMIVRKISDSMRCTLVVTPELFDCYLIKPYDKTAHRVKNLDTRRQKAEGDSCQFACTAYSHDEDGERYWIFIYGEYIALDVLPQTPVMSVSGVSVNPADSLLDFTVTITSDKFDYGMCYVETGVSVCSFEYFHENTEFLASAYWDETILCIVNNAYGACESNKIKITHDLLDGISDTEAEQVRIKTEGDRLNIERDSPFDVTISTIGGQVVSNARGTSCHTVTLPPAIYTIRIRVNDTNEVFNHKITIS